MPMPSLFKYFAFVGAALLGLLSLVNFLLDPSTGATAVSRSTPAKPAVVVEHDPRASKIERWRNEQAALRSAVVTETAQTAPATTAAAKATVQPVAAPATEPAKPAEQARAAVDAAPAAPVAAAPAIAPLQTSDASAITGVPTDDERAAEATRLKAEKAAKVKKARAARQKAEQAARERDIDQFFRGERQRNASNQQDQYYYSQRVPRERQSFNAFAPRQGYGPFGW
jgi:hypothetical protein